MSRNPGQETVKVRLKFFGGGCEPRSMKEALRPSRIGRQTSEKEQRNDCAHSLTAPTQAKTLEWNTRLQIAYRSVNGTTYFEHKNWLGTERLRTDYTGATAATYQSLSFGDGYTPNILQSAADQDNNHFATLDHDSETATEHAQFRQYASAQGLWMSPDPYPGSYDFNNPQSFNRYSYVLNNPLGATDSLGLYCDMWTGCGPPCDMCGGVGGTGGAGSPNGYEGGGGINGTGGAGSGGILDYMESLAEAGWLGSGSIPWYSVTPGGDLIVTLWGYQPNGAWNGDMSGNPSSDPNATMGLVYPILFNQGPLWSSSSSSSFATAAFFVAPNTGRVCNTNCHRPSRMPVVTPESKTNLNPCAVLAMASVPLAFSGVPEVAAYLDIGAGATRILAWLGVGGAIGGLGCM